MKNLIPGLFLYQLHIDMSLFRSFSVYFFGKILRGISTLYLIPLFTYNLNKAEFGAVGILWVLRPVFKRVIDFGTQAAYTIKFHKEGYVNKCSYLYNAILVTLINSVLFFCLLNIFLEPVKNYILDLSQVYLNIFLLVIVLDLLQLFFVGVVRQEDNPRYFVMFNSVKPFLTALTTTFLFFYFKPNYKFYILGMLVSNLILTPVTYIYLFNNYNLSNFKLEISKILSLVRIGFPMIPGSIGNVFLATGDRFVIKYFLGLEAVGIYTLGYKLAHYVNQLLFKPFNRAFGPIGYSKSAKNLEEAADYFEKVIYKATIIFSILVALAMIPGWELVNYLGRTGYNSAVQVYIFGLIGILLFHLAQVIRFLLNFIERTHFTALINILCAGCNIALNIYFVPRYGIMAAVIVTIFSYALMVGLNYISTKIFIDFKIRFSVLLLPLILLGIFALILPYLRTGYSVVGYYVISVSIFAVYFGILWYCSSHLRALIKDIFDRLSNLKEFRL